MSTETIIRALGVTAEAMGQQISPAGLLMMADDLNSYGDESVLQALTLVRRECRRLTVADVVDRIQSADGRLNSDEAWANSMLANDEAETIVWTEEESQAFWIARPLLEINDRTGARMAFRNAYDRLCSEARKNRKAAVWSVSEGWDIDRRRLVIESAVQVGRLSASYARGLLPPPEASQERIGTVLSLVSNNGLLTDKAATALDREIANKRLAEIKKMLKKGAA
jgi:hypothetical protein